MLIGGLQRLSLCDFPGRVAAVVFTECDSLQHWCWHILDESHPAHDPALAAAGAGRRAARRPAGARRAHVPPIPPERPMSRKSPVSPVRPDEAEPGGRVIVIGWQVVVLPILVVLVVGAGYVVGSRMAARGTSQAAGPAAAVALATLPSGSLYQVPVGVSAAQVFRGYGAFAGTPTYDRTTGRFLIGSEDQNVYAFSSR